MRLDYRAFQDAGKDRKEEYAAGYMVVYLSDAPMITATIYLGKSKKPYKNYRFPSLEKRSEYIQKMAQNVAANRLADLEYKVKAKADRKEGAIKFKAQLKPGVILQGSYGYEQTNQHFYEVIAVKGASVTIRELIHREIEQCSWASAYVVAATGENRFHGEEKTYRVVGRGIKIHSSMTVTIWDGEKCYSSWYA